ncbi:helix-turn-helix transcriptional regulator [Janthinobacterium sp. SUN211]|nr:helix-turn-helix transcriptional regulator [Janthinobacterium sp. SUN211]MDO8051442.1 helix-turn-helix transcriptional regulator [Janthinobacterium sp. SUN211]
MVMKQPSTVFGKRLKSARQRLGIPQDRLGWAIGLDEHTASARMSRYETGIHEPPYSLAQKLAEALGLQVAYFYADDDELAELILRWGTLRQIERTRLMSLLNTEFGDCDD